MSENKDQIPNLEECIKIYLIFYFGESPEKKPLQLPDFEETDKKFRIFLICYVILWALLGVSLVVLSAII